MYKVMEELEDLAVLEKNDVWNRIENENIIARRNPFSMTPDATLKRSAFAVHLIWNFVTMCSILTFVFLISVLEWTRLLEDKVFKEKEDTS